MSESQDMLRKQKGLLLLDWFAGQVLGVRKQY